MTQDRDYWERHAARYDLSTLPLRGPMPRMLKLVEEAVAGQQRVLEVAAGTGQVTAVLTRAATQVVATDYAAAMVEQLQLKMADSSNVICQQANLYHLPFSPRSFDAVVAANVLHLVPDLSLALHSLVSMLRPGGCLIVPTFCHDETTLSRLASRLLARTGFPGHRQFTLRSLLAAVEETGLCATRIERIAGLLPIVYVQASTAVPTTCEN